MFFENNRNYIFDESLPPQAIPYSRKNDDWRKWNMDVLERIAIKQYRDNLRFVDYYRMIEGKLSRLELSETLPELKGVINMLDEKELPSYIKHYDFVGQVVNLIIGELSLDEDKYVVTNVDDVSENEFLRAKTEKLREYLKQRLNAEIRYKLALQGINLDEQQHFKTKEEQQQYLQKVQQEIQRVTPQELEKELRKDFKTVAVEWAEHTLEYDKERFRIPDLDTKLMKDYLGTGRMFVGFHIGYDFYRPEYWSPIETFYDRNFETEDISKGEYIGRLRFMTASQIIEKWGHKLNETQKKALLNLSDERDTNKNKKQHKYLGMFEPFLVPFEGWDEYNKLLTLEDLFGEPMGVQTLKDDEGNTIEVPSFLPRKFDGSYNLNFFVNARNTPDKVRTDLYYVVEAYWRSYKKVGYLTYYDEEQGAVVSDIVTEDILKDFLKEKGIKQLHSKTLEDIEKLGDDVINTIVWDYIPEIWKGIKVGGLGLEKPIYIDINPLEYQIKGDSNIFDLRLPVAGYVGQSMVAKMLPYQVGYNIVMNQIMSFLAKELGVFFLFDVNFLPSEYKEWGDTVSALQSLYETVQQTGLFPIDASKQNLKGAGVFNQFSVQNMSFGGLYQSRVQLAEFFRMKALEQIGITPQRLGSPMKYETAEGIRVSNDASYAQTYKYFETFYKTKKIFLEMLLTVAQYSQKNEKDITVFYTKSDGELAYLKMSDPDFHLRKLGILPVKDMKWRKRFEQFKQYIIQMNTLGADELTLAKLFFSDSVADLIATAREARLVRQQQEQMKYQNEMAKLQQEEQMKQKELLLKYKLEDEIRSKDREADLKKAYISALGRAVDNNASPDELETLTKEAELLLKKEEANMKKKKSELDEKKLEQKATNNEERLKLEREKLKLKAMEIQARLKDIDAKKYIATVNKN